MIDLQQPSHLLSYKSTWQLHNIIRWTLIVLKLQVHVDKRSFITNWGN